MRQEGERDAKDIDVLRLKKPVSLLTSYEVRRNPRPTTCSHNSWLVNARKPMMCVTVLASQPSLSIPTEMTFLDFLSWLPNLAHRIDHQA
jgi:hypothetical protein